MKMERTNEQQIEITGLKVGSLNAIGERLQGNWHIKRQPPTETGVCPTCGKSKDNGKVFLVLENAELRGDDTMEIIGIAEKGVKVNIPSAPAKHNG